MNKSLLIYCAHQYGTNITVLLSEKFIGEFPHMGGYGVGVIIPEKIINRETIPKGLLSDYINEGKIVT